MRVGVVGTGVVGSTVAIRLQEKGYWVGALANRSPVKAVELAQKINAKVMSAQEVVRTADVILLSVPDRFIEPLTQVLAPDFRTGQVLVHFSGALSSEVMKEARQYGAKLLSIHPLQSFASVELALQSLPGTHFAVEGDELDIGVELVRALDGIPHCFDAQHKSLYHAAACIVSNYIVVLADMAAKLLAPAGFSKVEAVQALLPLMEGTLTNLDKAGLPTALTGPIARGDYPVVTEHLARLPLDAAIIYKALGQWAISIAEAKGTLDQENKYMLQQILEDKVHTGSK